MELAIFIVARTVSVILSIFSFMVLLRAIFSWIDSLRGHPISEFLINVTEPIVAPVRKFLHKFDIFRNSPIDLSTLFVVILISLIQTILSIAVQ